MVQDFSTKISPLYLHKSAWQKLTEHSVYVYIMSKVRKWAVSVLSNVIELSNVDTVRPMLTLYSRQLEQ